MTQARPNHETIPGIQAKIICGAANNQLEDTRKDDQALFERGITYVPDFLANRMGIVNCANEQYGYIENDHFIEQHFQKEWEYSIWQTTLSVLRQSKETGSPPAKVAVQMADRLSLKEHPIFGHRGYQIIYSLLKNKWQEKMEK